MARNKEPRARKPKNKKESLSKFFISIILAIFVFIALLVIQSGILSNYATTQVVVAKQAIAQGIDINENNYKEYFKYADLDASIVPEGTLTTLEDVLDNVAAQNISKGEFINQNALVSIDEIAQNIAGENGEVENLVVSGFSAGDLANTVCGILRRGDIIDITLIYEDENGEMKTKVMEGVYVKHSYDGNGNEIYAGQGGTATMFNFLLNKDDDALLNEIIKRGGIVRIRKTNNPEF